MCVCLLKYIVLHALEGDIFMDKFHLKIYFSLKCVPTMKEFVFCVFLPLIPLTRRGSYSLDCVMILDMHVHNLVISLPTFGESRAHGGWAGCRRPGCEFLSMGPLEAAREAVADAANVNGSRVYFLQTLCKEIFWLMCWHVLIAPLARLVFS